MRQINVNEEKKDKLSPEKIKEAVLVTYKRITVMSAIFIILLLSAIFVSKAFSADENALMTEYAKYMNYLYAKDYTQGSEHTKQVVIPAENTVDTDKINRDIKSAETLWEEVFTFKNGEEYDNARERLIQTFGEISAIVTEFFGENMHINVDGEDFSYVDVNNINMSFESIKTYPIDINPDGNNSYMSQISFTINTVNGNTVGYSFMVFYTVDEVDSIIDASAYMLKN